jgi:hypothetical protein
MKSLDYSLEKIQALLTDFSKEMLRDFETTQDEFKALTVQKVFLILEKRKLDTNMGKKEQFWKNVQHNMELFRSRVMDEFKGTIFNEFSIEQKRDYFFNYLDRNTNN